MQKVVASNFWIGLVVLLAIAFYLHNKQREYVKEISKNYVVTIAEIIDHYVVGSNGGYYIKYKYSVDSNEHVKSVGTIKFSSCYRTNECIGKKFLLFYNPNSVD